jgi:serine/threonine-protein kinase
MDNLAVTYGLQGRYVEAEELCRRALLDYEPQVSAEHRNRLAMQSNLAEYLRNQGRYPDAEALFKQVLEVQRRTMSPDDPFRQETLQSLALLDHRQGRETEAEPLLLEVLGHRRASLPADDPALADTLARLTLVLLAQGRSADAERAAREGWGILDARAERDWRTFAAQSQLGACALALQQFREAEPLLVGGFEGLLAWELRIPAIDRRCVREAGERLVRLGQALNQPERTAGWQRQLDAFDAREAARLAATQPKRAAP